MYSGTFKNKVLPSGTLSQILDWKKFTTARRSSQRVVNLVQQRWTLSAINCLPSSVERSWQYLQRSTFDRRARPVYRTERFCTARSKWGSPSRGSIRDSWYLFTSVVQRVRTGRRVARRCSCVRRGGRGQGASSAPSAGARRPRSSGRSRPAEARSRAPRGSTTPATRPRRATPATVHHATLQYSTDGVRGNVCYNSKNDKSCVLHFEKNWENR